MLGEIVKNIIKGKKVVLLGFGREGQSSYRFIRKLLPNKTLYIADNDEKAIHNDTMAANDLNLSFNLGNKYLDNINDFDIIIKSPGVYLDTFNNTIDQNKITSQSDLFLKAYSDKVIGITGTKGKSTTASLIYHILKYSGFKVLLNGNIGIPPFDVENDVTAATTIVMELSAHQLESVNVSPHIALLLNIYPEHLDHFGTLEKYIEAKLNIAKYQKVGDHLIIPKKNTIIEQFVAVHHPQQIQRISGSEKIPNINTIEDELPLSGEHNLFNILTAYHTCKIIGLTNKEILNGIKTFTPLEHRMEFVGDFKGVEYYNDSISTIPESTILAIKTVGNLDTVIIGGFDRGISYDKLVSYLIGEGPVNIVLTGKVGKRIYNKLRHTARDEQKIYFHDDFIEVVRLASQLTRKGYSCLFSPAAASYDKFKNFEERGRIFKELISESY